VNYTGDYTTWRNTLGKRTEKFIYEAGPIIFKYQHLIEYANGIHRKAVETAINPPGSHSNPVQLPPIDPKDIVSIPKTPTIQISPAALEMAQSLLNKVMNTTSTWRVTLKSDISVHGENHADLIRTLKNMGFLEQDLVSYEKLDTHQDLPLVQFWTYGPSQFHMVRVTKMDSTVVEGFEGYTWKKFLRSQITGRIEVVEIPAKKD
jgi:hypothetical protein